VFAIYIYIYIYIYIKTKLSCGSGEKSERARPRFLYYKRALVIIKWKLIYVTQCRKGKSGVEFWQRLKRD
jgi:hypothetical protein